jgi:tellurite resistance protein
MTTLMGLLPTARTRIPLTVITPQPPRRVLPNVFGISFGLAGLAQAWTVAVRTTSAPAFVAGALWLVAGAVWLVTLAAYLRSIVAGARLHTELADHTFGPFVSIPAIVGLLLAGGLQPYDRPVALGLFVASLLVAVVLAGRLLAIWALDDKPETQWHPGYYLPSVGAPLVAAATGAHFGYLGLARALFGLGVISWVLIGGILLHHLVGQQRLPRPLIPTMAILLAPPVVAGNAWFAIDGDRVDGVALGLAGYTVLMAVTQLGLLPAYRTVPFGPGWWSYSFPYAATIGNTILWLPVEHAPYRVAWTYLLLAVVTGFIGYLAARTVIALARGQFLPQPEFPAGASVSTPGRILVRAEG